MPRLAASRAEHPQPAQNILFGAAATTASPYSRAAQISGWGSSGNQG